MSERQQLPLGNVGTGGGLLLLWLITTAWLLSSGALALYLMIVNLLVGGLLLIAAVLLWWLLLRWATSWLLGMVKDSGSEEISWLVKARLAFGLTQLLVIICAVNYVLN